MRSSPTFQLIGVAIPFLSAVWRESMTRSTSAVLRPVDAGYLYVVHDQQRHITGADVQ